MPYFKFFFFSFTSSNALKAFRAPRMAPIMYCVTIFGLRGNWKFRLGAAYGISSRNIRLTSLFTYTIRDFISGNSRHAL